MTDGPGLFDRLRLAMRQRHEHAGFVLYVDDEQEARTLCGAIDLLERVDKRRFERARAFGTRVQTTLFGTHFDPGVSPSINLGTGDEPGALAAALVLESTHGWLLSRGIPYAGESVRRHEKLALDQEYRFLCRFTRYQYPSADDAAPYLAALAQWHTDAWKTEWYSPQGRRTFKLRAIQTYFRQLFRGTSR